MTRKRIIIPAAVTEAVAELTTGRGPESEAEQIDAELDGLAQQLPEGAVGSLYRFTEGAEKEFVDEMLVIDFSLTTVKQRYGGGRYILYLRTPDPNVAGKSFRQGSKRFRIAGPPIEGGTVSRETGAPAATLDAQRLLSSYADMIQAQVKSQLQGAEMLQTMQMAVLRNLTERAPDPSLHLMETILPALISRGGGGSDLGQIITLSERLATKSGPAAGLKETLELLKAARDFAGGSSDDGTPPWFGLASRGLDTIGKVLEHRAFAPTHDPLTSPLALASGEPPAHDTGVLPAPSEPPQPEEPTLPPNTHPLFSFLAPRMADLVTHASLDHDPTTYAGVLADLIPDAYADTVRAKILEPGFVIELTTLFPAAKEFASWFFELRADLADRLSPEEQPPKENNLINDGD